MLPRTRTPPKPEKAHNNPRRSYHGTVETMLRRDVFGSLRDGLAMLFLVKRAINKDACDNSNEDADADGYECEPSLRDREGVRRALEDEREGGEEEEEHTEGERRVQ